MLFKDRTAAGQLLTGQLPDYASRSKVLVLALPHGALRPEPVSNDGVVDSHQRSKAAIDQIAAKNTKSYSDESAFTEMIACTRNSRSHCHPS